MTNPTGTKTKSDIAYDKITDQMVAALEKGVVPWKKPWTAVGGLMPINVASKRPYNGVNVIILAFKPYTSHVWGTFKQWQAKGAFVRKGEKASCILKWLTFAKKDKDGNVEIDEKGNEKKIFTPKYYSVFNAEQVDGIDIDEYTAKPTEIKEFKPIEQAEQVVKNMPKCPEIKHIGNRASYSPSLDVVKMPKAEQFVSSGEYYSTLFHELGHSTGHESRVGRDIKNSFGDDNYSKEELVAELTTCFVCSHVGITQTFDNSAAYIKGWLKTLKGDNKLIVQASSQAQKATKYILDIKEDDTKA